MSDIKFDLKSFRESNLKLSQVEFANLIGLRQDAVSRMEKNPSQIPIDVLLTIATKTGLTLDQLVNYRKPTIEPLKVAYTWKTADFTKRTIVDYIDNYAKQFKEVTGSKYKKYISDLRTGVETAIRKPKIAVVGRSDVGKSALINSLIGEHRMPTAWTPTTSIPVYIKHISERPAYMEEDVWIFRNSKNNASWDDGQLDNEEYCREWKLTGGSADLLASYGTRQGENYGENEAGSAVIFVDSEILKNCDILDLPGYGTGDRAEDDTMTLNAKQNADILIYLSLANGFMRDEDIIYLRDAITMLDPVESKDCDEIKPLSNLFIVASQAHTVDGGNMASITNILDRGCERFEKTITDTFWTHREDVTGKKYGHDTFRDRFFAFTTDVEHVRHEFEENLRVIVEVLPKQIEKKAKEFVRSYAKNIGINLDSEIASYEKMLKEKEKYEQLLLEIEKKEPLRANENQSRRRDMTRNILKYRKASINTFEDKYDEIISVDNIVEIIDNRGYKKKKEDVQLLSAYITSLLDDDLQDVLKSNSKKLSRKIDDYIAAFEGDCTMGDISAVNLNVNFFDAKRSFASGLVGLATFGALAFWASTLGNLGAYILVAKGVSLLSAIGISVGGTAAAASTVAAIGGPVVLGVALAIIATIGVFATLSGSWKKGLAKKIVKVYNEKDALMKYKTNIESFWSDTQSAFNAAADNMEQEWKSYITNLQDLMNNYDIHDIKNRIIKAKEVKLFFDAIPL